MSDYVAHLDIPITRPQQLFTARPSNRPFSRGDGNHLLDFFLAIHCILTHGPFLFDHHTEWNAVMCGFVCSLVEECNPYSSLTPISALLPPSASHYCLGGSRGDSTICFRRG